jgi:CubicO group peptidase (beta-lactamase class C family)
VAEGKSPAVFAACGGPGGATAEAASGVRKQGQPDAATAADLVHIGSCTKAMTAVLIARLVEQGKLNWDDTIALRLPQLSAQIDTGWHDRTLVQLLSHTAGVPTDAKNWIGKGATVDDKRRGIITTELAGPPAADAPPWNYSNLGVMIAGQMAAETEGTSWEDLIRREVFEPLGMASPGFGPPGQLRTIEQPFGHTQRKDSKYAPVFLDNPPPLGPAGRVHLPLADWLKFTSVFCGGGPEGFLSAASLEKLTTPVANDYALGWVVTERDWGKGTVLQHNGSNGLWMAACWVAPATGRAYLAVVNQGGEQAGSIVDEAISRLIALDPAVNR